MRKWEAPSMEMLAINETAHGFFGCGEDGCFVSCHQGHRIPVYANISIGPITITPSEDNKECGKVDELS